MIKNLIQQGSIITLIHFLHNYKELDEKKETYTYDPMYQPCAHYGNRFQAQPTWETEELNKIDLHMFESIKDQIQKLFTEKITKFKCRIRLTLTSELKKSVQFKNNHMGFVHHDTTQFAGIIPFDQSFEGGTAFFENEWDKVPDIVYGSWPNRLILYNAQRNHAACHDFTFEKRYCLLIFFNLNETT